MDYINHNRVFKESRRGHDGGRGYVLFLVKRVDNRATSNPRLKKNYSYKD